jgi:hypothetical protein
METLDKGSAASTDPPAPEAREHVRQRLLARQDFGSHLLVYVIVNVVLLVVWATSGAAYFWPGWVLAGWGALLILHARETFWRRPITEADIDAEIRRRAGH